MDAVNETIINRYFSLLNELMETHDLIGSPEQIYNVDQIGMHLNPML